MGIPDGLLVFLSLGKSSSEWYHSMYIQIPFPGVRDGNINLLACIVIQNVE